LKTHYHLAKQNGGRGKQKCKADHKMAAFCSSAKASYNDMACLEIIDT
jgi:hypothetical protein